MAAWTASNTHGVTASGGRAPNGAYQVRLADPRSTWEDPLAYDAQAEDLVHRFNVNFEQFASGVTVAVREAAPASTAVVS